ncbi:MAG TPA: hypothetical protein DD381_00455 [Lentisphaeria bacterium]|nr:MAG: hypothetical protein A2X47_05080 [Lentisphaerae bacterium GWF2_38_69]HBM14813.1 hypothetical protein [Lentisphaeria bacterium]
MIYQSDRKDESDIIKFTITLAELMTCYGATVHEVEDTIASLHDALGVTSNFVLFNKYFFSAFGEPHNQQVTFKRFFASGVNIKKLELVEKVYLSVASGELTVEQGLEQLTTIKASRKLYNQFFEFLSWPLISASFVFILFGSWKEVICSCLISIVIYFINNKFSKNDVGTGFRIAIPISAFVAAVLSVFIYKFIYPVTIYVVVISSLMKFMPGLSLTQAMTEIAYRRLFSGMAHLCDAVCILALLSMGSFLGIAFGSLFSSIPIQNNLSVPPAWELCFSGIAVSFSLIFTYDIIKKHIVPVVIASMIVTVVWIWGKEVYGAVYGTGLAAMLGAVIANTYARLSRCSDLVIKIPTAIITVPGIFGFKSLIEIFNSGNITGLDHFLTTFALGAAIAGGFLLSDIVIPPASHPRHIKVKPFITWIGKTKSGSSKEN